VYCESASLLSCSLSARPFTPAHPSPLPNHRAGTRPPQRHTRRFIEFDEDAATVRISPSGVHEVEQRIKKKPNK
jgi:hypothetical protein